MWGVAGIEIPSALIGGAIGALGGVGVQEYRFWRERRHRKREAAQEWYDEALQLISRVTNFGERATRAVDFDYAEMEEATSELSDRLMAHASSPPELVDEESRTGVAAVATFCSAASLFGKTGEGRAGQQQFDAFLEWARQQSDTEMEFEEAQEWVEGFANSGTTDFEEAEERVDIDEEALDNEKLEEWAESVDEDAIETVGDVFDLADSSSDAFPDEALGSMMEVVSAYYARLLLVDYPKRVFHIIEEKSS
jgi:hypothetical protein